jgi:hypothetical protein
MGLPEPIAERPTFYFPATETWPPGTIKDTEGRPIDPRIKATATKKDPVQVPCAVEFSTDQSNQEGLTGTRWDGRALLTFLDEDYVKVKDAIEVKLAGRVYTIQEMIEFGLGTVSVYQLQVFRKGVEA